MRIIVANMQSVLKHSDRLAKAISSGDLAMVQEEGLEVLKTEGLVSVKKKDKTDDPNAYTDACNAFLNLYHSASRRMHYGFRSDIRNWIDYQGDPYYTSKYRTKIDRHLNELLLLVADIMECFGHVIDYPVRRTDAA